MSDADTVSRAAAELRDLAKRVAREDSSLGGQIELMSEELAGLAGPPTRAVTEFNSPGEPVALPDRQSEIGTGAALERIIGDSNFLPASFLEQGAITQRAVARVVLTAPAGGLPAGSGWGTGFMVSDDFFITNNHVIPDVAFAQKIRVQFNYQLSMQGIEQATESYFYDTAGVFHTNASLDYTVLKLRKQAPVGITDTTHSAGERWGWIPLQPNVRYFAGQHFNVVQHPAGRRKEIALQDNEISALFQNFVRYTADTEPGSSGSPVFDNLWRLVALHHAGGAQDNSSGRWLNNQGVRVDRIVHDLRQHFAAQIDVLGELGIGTPV